MLLTIYDKAGAKRADVAASDSSTQSKEVQGDNVLALSFTHYAHIPLDVGDFTDYIGERYWLTERYTPKPDQAFSRAGDNGRRHQSPVYIDGHAP